MPNRWPEKLTGRHGGTGIADLLTRRSSRSVYGKGAQRILNLSMESLE